jgi:aminoglycoside phosphotransferase (APT) family kinase protein
MDAVSHADVVVPTRDAIDEGVYLDVLRAAGVAADDLGRPQATGFESGKSAFDAFEVRKHGATTARVVVKRSPSGANLLARREVAFYKKIAPRVEAPVLARCYGVLLSESDGAFHLLLEDLRESHRKLESDFVSHPGEPAIRALIRAIAPVHAAWWEHPELEALDPLKGPEELGAFYAHWASELERLAPSVMSKERHAVFIRGHEALRECVKRGAGRGDRRSIVHADAHPRNVLMPRSETSEGARLIDWERWTATSPARDLAYVLSFGYAPSAKRSLRTRALHHHFEMLGEAGVSNYDWHQYLDDYHRAVLACLPNLVWLLEAASLEEFWDQLLVNYADEVQTSLRALRF